MIVGEVSFNKCLFFDCKFTLTPTSNQNNKPTTFKIEHLKDWECLTHPEEKSFPFSSFFIINNIKIKINEKWLKHGQFILIKHI